MYRILIALTVCFLFVAQSIAGEDLTPVQKDQPQIQKTTPAPAPQVQKDTPAPEPIPEPVPTVTEKPIYPLVICTPILQVMQAQALAYRPNRCIPARTSNRSFKCDLKASLSASIARSRSSGPCAFGCASDNTSGCTSGRSGFFSRLCKRRKNKDQASIQVQVPFNNHVITDVHVNTTPVEVMIDPLYNQTRYYQPSYVPTYAQPYCQPYQQPAYYQQPACFQCPGS